MCQDIHVVFKYSLQEEIELINKLKDLKDGSNTKVRFDNNLFGVVYKERVWDIICLPLLSCMEKFYR